MCTWLARSIALHPDKVTVATGQVAGHDKNAGKVCTRISITFQLHPPCPAASCPSHFTGRLAIWRDRIRE